MSDTTPPSMMSELSAAIIKNNAEKTRTAAQMQCLVDAVQVLMFAVGIAAGRFEHYGTLHAAKGNEDGNVKAASNRAMAKRMWDAMHTASILSAGHDTMGGKPVVSPEQRPPATQDELSSVVHAPPAPVDAPDAPVDAPSPLQDAEPAPVDAAPATPLPRTATEIVARMRHLADQGEDWMGTIRGDLVVFLPFADAQPFLKAEATAEAWAKVQKPSTQQAVIAAMLEYMPFAWGEANDCRGLSAGRSVQHMEAWLWLLADPLGENLEGIFNYYSKTCLRAVCEAYGWDWRQWDDGDWRNNEEGPALPPQETGL